MARDAGSSGAREVVLVLAVAGAGLALAAVAAFGPWQPSYDGPQGRGATRSFTPGTSAEHSGAGEALSSNVQSAVFGRPFGQGTPAVEPVPRR
ncbi:hypothetical protein ACFFKH_03045 [Micromonospora marina]|uniref:Uncharacterized protein n=1 Tax=Micromonospora marina TaxID=307120 RepID=A0A1C4U108_9ACTN|nr:MULTISPECIES: hypothetical protein [Micromonospora]SCE65383.1 hypothetical protein GA0070215_101159 [Micromonospora marina]